LDCCKKWTLIKQASKLRRGLVGWRQKLHTPSKKSTNRSFLSQSLPWLHADQLLSIGQRIK
jgi:hypothetical protein